MSFIKDKTLGLFVKTNGIISKYFFAGKGLILMLHRVRPTLLMSKFEQNRVWEITPEHLEDVIKFFLKNKYCVISLNNINDYLTNRKSQPFVIFTFDDGYYDNIEYAYPIFEKYNIPFTIFITTQFALGKRYPWEFIIENFLIKKDSFSFQYLNEQYSCNNQSENEKSKSFSLLYPIIKNNNNVHYLDFILNSIFGEFLKSDYKTVKMIDTKVIKDLKNDNVINFGIHTDNHYVLSQLSYDEQLNEIVNAKRIIEELIEKTTSEFAYPFGGLNDINQDTLKAVSSANIKYCVTSWPGNIFSSSNKLLFSRHFIKMKTDEKELAYLTNGIRHFSYNGFSTDSAIENYLVVNK